MGLDFVLLLIILSGCAFYLTWNHFTPISFLGGLCVYVYRFSLRIIGWYAYTN